MRPVSQVSAIINQEMASAIFTLEATIVSVAGGKAVVKPTARRVFADNDEPFDYPEVSNVRLISLVWNGGKSGLSGGVKAGDECLLIAISHSDAEQPDHKTLSACCAITGFSDASAFPMPDAVGLRIFHNTASISMDDNITIDNGNGARAVFDGGAIRFDAPEGFTFNGDSQFNGNVGIAGGLQQTAGEGGASKASFAGDMEIAGTSKAADHLSGGVSGKGHRHKENGDGGGTTDAPMQG